MSESDKRDIRLRYIDFVNQRFFCLPFDLPEEALWDDDAVRLILGAAAVDTAELEKLHQLSPKARFASLADMVAPGEATTSQDINAFQRVLISRFCKAKGRVYQQLVGVLKEIADHA